MKGIKFSRARMPTDAIDDKLRLIGAVDAASNLKIAGVWAGFRRRNGEYSCQLLIGRSLLSSEDSTIPKEELEALTAGSNLLWICRMALSGWVDEYLLVGDSVISICWVCSEKKRLSLFHRNRTIQVRRGTDLDKIYHVQTSQNPADVATRPEKVTMEDVGPDSGWKRGMSWMTGEVDEAVAKKILTPSKDLKIQEDDQVEYDKGIVF